MCFCTPNRRTPFCPDCNQAMFLRIAEYRDTIAQQAELLAAHKDEVQDLQRQLLATQQERDEYKKDAERLHYLEESLFEGKWNGVLGNGSARNWRIHGSYRHTMQNFVGQTFREAIDAAIAKVKS